MIIVSDIHISVNRVSGTTPQSREDLRTYVFAEFDKLLHLAYGNDLCILGDLFDAFEVAPRDWLESYLLLADWCTKNPDCTLDLVAGNHDVSMKGSKVSSFETLATVLKQQFGNVDVTGIDCTSKAYLDGFQIYIVAHHRNQELFDLALAEVLEECERGDYVLLHANYDNKFAERSDHSLNVSEARALEFTKKGTNLVFAHEHQSRVEIPHGTPADGGSVICLGNQIGTSCSDWIGSVDKYYWRVN